MGLKCAAKSDRFDLMHPDRRLDEFAAHQYGAFSRDQAESVGLTRSMIETRRTSGAWIDMAPSVYVLASAPPRWERQMAAALLSRPGSVVAGKAAAHLHDFVGFRPGRPVVIVGPHANARSPLAQIIRSHYFDDLDVIRKAGFRVTSEPETIVTIARSTPAVHLERVVDDVLARGSCDVESIVDLASRRPRVPGLNRLQPILLERRADAYQPPTSELERHLYRLLDHSSIPSVTRQMPFEFDRVAGTADAYIPAWRLIVEADGRRWHTRKSDMERDRLRDNEAAAHGFAVLRFTWKLLTSQPDVCLDQLCRTGITRQTS